MEGQTDLDFEGVYRTSPTAPEAIAAWLQSNRLSVPVHDQPWDVTNPDIYGDDCWQPIFAEMRRTAPVNKVTGTPYGDYWNVTKLKDIQYVESLPKIFSSHWHYGGISISEPPPGDEELVASFIAMDPPDHTVRRRTVAPAFTPAEMTRLAGLVRQRTVEILERLPVGEQFDWVERVSVELTTGMLATIFDFPWKQRHLLSFWSDWMSDTILNQSEELGAMRREFTTEMADCFHKLWQQRAEAPPTPDLLSRMIHSDAMNKIDPMEFMGSLVLLIIGGNETTRNTMTGFVEALDRFPEERAKLDANRELIPNAVQECIRYVSPVAHMRRTATQDTELAGQQIKAGDKVILWYVSANRDESIFTEPDRLIVDRENARRHVSFGYGIHRCIGARLAELQLRILIEEMLDRSIRARVTGEVERVRAIFVHGFRKAEVTLERG